MSNVEKLDDVNLDNISGGNIMLKDVVGISGLECHTGRRTLASKEPPDGLSWYYNGIRITKKQAFSKMFKKGTQDVNDWIDKVRFMGYDEESLDFFEDYIRKYNEDMDE